MVRESHRRTLRGKGNLSLKAHTPKKHEGEILSIAVSPVFTTAPTTPIYDAIQAMSQKGFRRVPIANPGTSALVGIVTAVDIIDYLGGGRKFSLISRKFGGNVFKAINEPMKLIMTQKVVTVKTTAKIGDAIKTMVERNVGGLPVVNDSLQVKAIITERDIAALFSEKISGVTVEQLMSQSVVTATTKTTIFEAARAMVSEGFRRLPLVSDGKLVGIVTAMDIIRFFGSGEFFRHLRSGTINQVLNTPVLDIATKAVSTTRPTTNVGQVAKIMQEESIGAVPVVENHKLVGMLTERDFFKMIQ